MKASFDSAGGHDGKLWPPPGEIDVSRTTGPLTLLAGKRVVCIADFQNLAFSALDLGFELSWHSLARKLRSACAAAELHLVLSDREAGQLDLPALRESGWTLHVRRTERWGREPLKPNADHLFSFLGGLLAAGSPKTELFVLGTGDGELALDTAQMLVAAAPASGVATLSVAGSTSQRLDAERACDIDFNLEVGLDCLR